MSKYGGKSKYKYEQKRVKQLQTQEEQGYE